jgi:glyoxylase-like metal-dependent hydrolase (beta-lactamase superfamily II)
MRRDRIAEDIYTFSSDVYAQVVSGVILTSEGSIVIDTLPFPEETREVLAFARERGRGPVRYVINTHHHSDHTNGNYIYAEAEVIGHRLCRQRMLTQGARSLADAKRDTPELNEVELRAPNIVFEHDMFVHLGGRSLLITPLPGHTDDSIGVMIEGDRILFSGDAVLPVPHIVWGDTDETARTLRAVRTLKPESVIQGHGDLLLKGELAEEIESSIHYLESITTRVRELVQNGAPQAELQEIDIESCGKSRVPLDGLVQFLHRDNLAALYSRYLKASNPKVRSQRR